MVWSQKHSLEGWNVKRVPHPYGVYLSIVVFLPELECTYSLDGNTRSYSVNLVVSLNKLEVGVKLVCAICHAVQCMTIHTHEI